MNVTEKQTEGLGTKHQLYKHHLTIILCFLNICLCLSLVQMKGEVPNNAHCHWYLLLDLPLDNALPVDPSSTGRGTAEF